jgi:hypothetical protein
MATQTVSPAQLAANRENAQLSTGPRTEEGKARSSQNARVHGLFSKWLVLDGEDRAQFDALLADLREDLQPQGYVEETLVHDIARNRWRLARLMRWEWTSQQAKMNEAAEELDLPTSVTAVRAFRILAEQTKLLPLYLRYENMFNRQFNRCLDTLRKLQSERKENKKPQLSENPPESPVQNKPIPAPPPQPKPASPAPPKRVRKVKKLPRPARRAEKDPPGARQAR